MINERNLDPSLRTKIAAGGYNVGWNGAAANGLGGFWYVDYAGNVAGNGRSWDEPFSQLSDAITAMKKWDTIFIAPGGESSNFSTPLDADAPFAAIIGMRQGDMGIATWFGQSSNASPLLNVRGKGLRISGIEFDGGTTEPSIMLNGRANSMRSDYTLIDHCAFFAGTRQIELDGEDGPLLHYVITDNHFEAAVLTAIGGRSTAFAVPRGGRIERNVFVENAGHMNFEGRGLNQTIIRGNSFQGTGLTLSAVDTKIIDLSGGNVNLVEDNYFGIADGTGANQYDETAGVLIAGTNDSWIANKHMGGITDKNPASGS